MTVQSILMSWAILFTIMIAPLLGKYYFIQNMRQKKKERDNRLQSFSSAHAEILEDSCRLSSTLLDLNGFCWIQFYSVLANAIQ